MKRTKIMIALGLALGVALAPSTATAAECVPADAVWTEAWTETIEHPEVTETVVVTEAWTEVIEHDAVTETVVDQEAWVETIEHPAIVEYVDHEAVYATEHLYKKQVKGITQQRDNGKGQWHTTGQGFDWTWWTPASTKWSEQDVEVLESGPHNATVRTWTQGNGNKQWREQSTHYRYVKTGETRQGQKIKDAWTEEKVVEAAWTETITHPATYKTVVVEDAWTETVEHPAVTEVRVVTEAWTETVEHEAELVSGEVTCPPVAEPEPEPETARLADTGADPWTLGGLAALLVLVGGGAVAVARKRRTV